MRTKKKKKKRRKTVVYGVHVGASRSWDQFLFRRMRRLELPVAVDRLDGPFEFLAERLGEKLLDGHVELLGEDGSETRVDVVLLMLDNILIGSIK